MRWLSIDTGATLRDADCRRSTMRSADLSKADLTKAMLDDADLGGAQMQQARLDGAQIERAVFSFADLREAQLIEIDKAHGASFDGAKLQARSHAGMCPCAEIACVLRVCRDGVCVLMRTCASIVGVATAHRWGCVAATTSLAQRMTRIEIESVCSVAAGHWGEQLAADGRQLRLRRPPRRQV